LGFVNRLKVYGDGVCNEYYEYLGVCRDVLLGDSVEEIERFIGAVNKYIEYRGCGSLDIAPLLEMKRRGNG
jgi:hypothetical protein